MSEWQPIDEAPKFDGGIRVWHGGDLAWAVWRGIDEPCWHLVEDILGWGESYSKMNPQPKFFIHIDPPQD